MIKRIAKLTAIGLIIACTGYKAFACEQASAEYAISFIAPMAVGSLTITGDNVSGEFAAHSPNRQACYGTFVGTIVKPNGYSSGMEEMQLHLDGTCIGNKGVDEVWEVRSFDNGFYFEGVAPLIGGVHGEAHQTTKY